MWTKISLLIEFYIIKFLLKHDSAHGCANSEHLSINLNSCHKYPNTKNKLEKCASLTLNKLVWKIMVMYSSILTSLISAVSISEKTLRSVILCNTYGTPCTSYCIAFNKTRIPKTIHSSTRSIKYFPLLSVVIYFYLILCLVTHMGAMPIVTFL